MKAKFHLPDFTYLFKLNYLFADMVEHLSEYFYSYVEIASIDDAFPPALWNGGSIKNGKCSPDYIRHVINSFNRKGIPLRFTFTNVLIEEKHLKDEFCNNVLKMADNGMNEVTVASPLLEDHIRSNFPNYKITAAVSKHLDLTESAAADLEKDYLIVALDHSLNNKFDTIQNLPHKERCEFVANCSCSPECKMCPEHFKYDSARNLAYMEHLRKNPNGRFNPHDYPQYSKYFNSDTEKCIQRDRNLYHIMKLESHITPTAIREKYLPMGFEHFSIETNGLRVFDLIDLYMYYFAKPECRDEARYRFISQLVNQGIIKMP